ncbi:ankyrin repeat domain-containing protein [Actinomycetospora lemnae]|uniref:Ankyrin repeat domain-containing protein n=1 Tax=Actinomycetospora lemnae TaxID=3019891 RepID=A0ABT5SMI3_9PSEU|nr:ankyrin repeat domain-containing protein [Actinomycetospora sp. DW7H6]MDD7964045.1 ankyrin repeat domain-containing protein [Actinomycetospora sp. DW7H6]
MGDVEDAVTARDVVVGLVDAASRGLDDAVTALLHVSPSPGWDEVDLAFWSACRGGHLSTVEILFRHGAQLNRCQHHLGQTPLDAAIASGDEDLVRWLRVRGGSTAAGLRRP